jgi:hypothetical protein
VDFQEIDFYQSRPIQPAYLNKEPLGDSKVDLRGEPMLIAGSEKI